LTGRNVASGVCDRATISGWRRARGWHYVECDNYDAAKAIAAFLVRDAKYALVITSGARNYPRNYARTGVGVELWAADAQGVRLTSADAHGVGSQNTDISPPRWSPAHDHVTPPQPWRHSFDANILKQTMAAPADVPWGLIPAMTCDPDSIVLKYVEPAFDDPQPSWLANVGMEEMMRKSAKAGDNAIVTGMDHTSQIVGPRLTGYYLANQTWDFGFLFLAMVTIKLVQEQSSYRIVWPQLAAAKIDDDFDPNVANVTRASAAEGSSIFLEDDVLPDNVEHLNIVTRLRHSAEDVLDEIDEATFLATSYVGDLVNSDSFSRARCVTLVWGEKPGVDYTNAHLVTREETLLTFRAWLSCFNAPIDRWLWRQARVGGEWCRIPWRTGVSAEQHVRDGRERRYVPTSYQVLPGITRRGSIPESRAGRTDNYMTRPKSPVVVPGVWTFTQLIKERDRAGSCADFLGDGCVCYLVVVVQVVPSGISTDAMEHSYGNIFCQEVVRITHLLVRRVPISKMAMGGAYISRNGVVPEALWAQRCTLDDEQMARRRARPLVLRTRNKDMGIKDIALTVSNNLGVANRPLADIVGKPQGPVAPGSGAQHPAGADVDVGMPRDPVAPGSGVQHLAGADVDVTGGVRNLAASATPLPDTKHQDRGQNLFVRQVEGCSASFL
jgi:hypothetical protein